MKTVDVVKWVATAVQLVGYGLTGLNIVPWNVFAFFIGIFLWFAVGVMWKTVRFWLSMSGRLSHSLQAI